jgi:hypothetical protein
MNSSVHHSPFGVHRFKDLGFATQDRSRCAFIGVVRNNLNCRASVVCRVWPSQQLVLPAVETSTCYEPRRISFAGSGFPTSLPNAPRPER